MPCTRSTASKVSQMESRLSVPSDGCRYPAQPMRIKIRTLLIVAVGVACLQIQTIPFLPPAPHYVFDVLRLHEMRESTNVNGYTVALVQKPSGDPYYTYFEISTAAHQDVSRLMIDPDADKWRKPIILRQGGNIYFCDGSKITDSTPFVDVDAMTIHYRLGAVSFDVLTFSGGWDR
jgi:hypothetical protein